MRGDVDPQRMLGDRPLAGVVEGHHEPPQRWPKQKHTRRMPPPPEPVRSPDRWAQFRFCVVGALLAAPPAHGQLQAQLQALAARTWRHPITGDPGQWGASTIERWYYTARKEKQDPVRALRRKRRSDHGQHPSLSPPLREALLLQYRQHATWSYQLHVDNLAVVVERDPALGHLPSYESILRYMKAHGLLRRPRRGPPHSPGGQAAQHRFQAREVRSYQSEHVHGLWHLDFHHGTLRVLRADGQWAYPLLLAILDDCCRLCCHAQWYLAEGVEELCHGVGQGFEKRALPRALMSDNGSAMGAAEFVQGLGRLGIVHETTLPFSPYQNGKQESFWNQVEGRLLPMLEGVSDLSLTQLNQATQAWVEMEYNRAVHSELGHSPLRGYLDGKDVGRPCPSTEELALAFTTELTRTQRRSDGTISLQGRRLEIPSRYGHCPRVALRYASWDLARVHLVDPATGAVLCRVFPLDKAKNAQGQRALRQSPLGPAPTPLPAAGLAPLLEKILRQYATTGLPPAYLPKDPTANPS